jgi:hypothetical protein
MTTYTLTFHNRSKLSRSFLCYQKDFNLGVPDVVSLAWWAKVTHPKTQVDFSWTIDYSMIWSEMGDLQPGVHFTASETLAADPSGKAGPNSVELDYEGGAFEFKNASAGGSAGSLTIKTGPGFPAGAASVAIGMSGSGTFAVSAAPQDNVLFTPHPEYWVAFGTFNQGDVLDITQISNSAKIEFPPNVYAMTAIYDEAGNWTITPTKQVNAMVAYARLLPDLGKVGFSEPLSLSAQGAVPVGPYTKVSVVDPLGGTILSDGTGNANADQFAAMYFQQGDLPKVGQKYNVTGYDKDKKYHYFTGKCTKVTPGAQGSIGVFENS